MKPPIIEMLSIEEHVPKKKKINYLNIISLLSVHEHSYINGKKNLIGVNEGEMAI